MVLPPPDGDGAGTDGAGACAGEGGAAGGMSTRSMTCTTPLEALALALTMSALFTTYVEPPPKIWMVTAAPFTVTTDSPSKKSPVS
jgi:hypothetical protein